MILNLKKDYKTIYHYIKQRVSDYPKYINHGPGHDEDPIKMMSLGYQYDQAGWVALVFDTRSDAKVDGEWTGYIDDLNIIELPHWLSTFEALDENEEPVNLTLPSGKKQTIDEYDDEVIATILGEMLRDILLEVHKKGVLANLPLEKDLIFAVEEFNGHFGWINSDDRSEFESQLDEDLSRLVPTMPESEQIDYLMKRLDRMAAGKDCDMEYYCLEVSRVFDYLEELGQKTIVPLLKLASKWANKPEWDGDRPRRNIVELPMQDVVINAIWAARDSGCATNEVEKLLRTIVRKSIKVNENRKLWGIIPYHAADCLQTLFKNYPKPKWRESDNKLANTEKFS